MSSESRIVIWGIGTSRTLRVHWLAHELGLDYEVQRVGARTGETQTPEYLAMSPKGKVPVMTHDDLVLTESAAILTYLTEVFADEQRWFVPQTARERGVLWEWCFYVMTELDAHPLYIMRRHEALADVYGEAPDAVQSAREYFYRLIGFADARIGAAAPYLFGERPSIADILLTTTLNWANNYGLQLSDELLKYAETVTARQAYQSAHAMNYPS